jgi:hypothetical protein
LPPWLQEEHFDALNRLARRGLEQIARVADRDTVRSILAIVAIWKGMRVYSRLLLDFSEDGVSDIAKKVLG